MVDQSISAPRLVGRDREIATILDRVKAAVRGEGAELLVRGAGGIGKSRILQAVIERLGPMGVIPVHGRAAQSDRRVPYALFRSLLRGLAAMGPADVRDAATDLDRQLDVSGRWPEESPAAQAPSEIYASVLDLVTRLSARDAVVIVAEDVHQADPDSLSLLARLFRQLSDLPVLGIASVRTSSIAESPQLFRFAEQFTTHERGFVLDVGPLDRPEVRALVVAVHEAHPAPELVELVYESSGGNPLFAIEAALSLAPAPSADEAGSARHRPRPPELLHVTAPLVDRFFGAGGPELDMARVLSVFTRFSIHHLSLVASTIDLDETRAARTFDRLVSKRVLVTADGGYEFTHSVLRDALYESIGPAERRRLHRMIADHLEGEIRSCREVDVSELATHLAGCAEPGDERAVEVLTRAGRAGPAAAPLVSARWFAEAAELLPTGSPERAALLAQQATAMFRASVPVDVARLGREALHALPPGPERRRTLSETANSLYITGDVRGAVDVIDDEERRFGELSIALQAQRANYLAQAGRETPAVPNHAELAADDRPAELTVTMMHDLQRAGLRGDAGLAARLMRDLMRHSRSATHHVRVAVTSLVAIEHLYFSDIATAARMLDEAAAASGSSRHLSVAGQLEVAAVVLAYEQGRWDEALQMVPDVLWELEQTQAFINLGWLRDAECRILLERGELRAASDLAASLIWHIESNRPSIECTRAKVAAAHGDTAGAVRLLQESRSRLVESGWRYGLDEVLSGLIALHSDMGDTSSAREYLAELEHEAQRTAWPAGRVRAALARARLDGDAEAARHAFAVASDAGLRLPMAQARLVMGRLDCDAQANLTSAYRFFDAVGSLARRQQAAAELRARKLPVPRQTSGSRRLLTDTESTLARLVSEGLTNREIAQVLHYSVKTVETYLTRVYGKTGTRSRLELARAVDKGELGIADGRAGGTGAFRGSREGSAANPSSS